ncbi:WXG100 family type VII secretion target [Streptomyces sp. NPDC001941]|uniref:WXG100 family type VII secretion target n=1 Tax=Streptomyces sp. NPDC001941 TaxID=3154659 RepID=UPI00331DF8A8
MAVDGFRGNPEQMRQIVQAMIQAGNQFGQALDSLESNLATTISGWEGESKDVYAECQANWDRLAKELQVFLGKAANGVENVADIYHQQDQTSAANFGG